VTHEPPADRIQIVDVENSEPNFPRWISISCIPPDSGWCSFLPSFLFFLTVGYPLPIDRLCALSLRYSMVWPSRAGALLICSSVLEPIDSMMMGGVFFALGHCGRRQLIGYLVASRSKERVKLALMNCTYMLCYHTFFFFSCSDFRIFYIRFANEKKYSCR